MFSLFEKSDLGQCFSTLGCPSESPGVTSAYALSKKNKLSNDNHY